MENTEVVHPWEQGEDDELEEGLIARRKNPNQTPLFITINADFSSNNFDSLDVTNGKHQHQQQEQEMEDNEEEEVKDFSQQNGIKVDEHEKEKQQTSEYSVYHDTDTGIWKCRICSWDNKGRTCLTHHNQHPKQHPRILVNVKTIYETKGNRLHFESSLVEANDVDSNTHGKAPMQENTDVSKDKGDGLRSVITNQNGEHPKQEISFEEVEQKPASYINNKTDTTDIQVIKDGDDETTEYDVETVLKHQDTHDLFCPNCNSCITKRVILRKRKHRIPVPGDDAKRNKSQANIVASEVNVVPTDVNVGLDVDPLTSNEYDQKREPEVFRCLSCFSIFMPTGDGFKLFRMFGNKNKEEVDEGSQKEVPVKKNWFSKLFASNEVKQLNNQGAGQSLDIENNVSGSSGQEVNSNNNNVTIDLENKPLKSVISRVGRDENAPISSTKGPVAIEQLIDKESDNSRKESNGAIQSLDMENHVADSSRQETYSNNTKGMTNLEKNQLQQAISGAGNDKNALFSTQEPAALEQKIAKESDDHKRETNGRIEENPLTEQLLTSYHIEPNGKSEYTGMFVVKPPLNNVESAENVISPLHNDGLKLLVPPNVGSLIIDNSQMNQELDVTVQINNPVIPASNLGQSNLDGQINVGLQTNIATNGKQHKTYKDKEIVPKVTEQHTFQNNVEILLDDALKENKDVLTDKQIKLIEEFKNIERTKGKDTIITIESKQPDASAIQRLGEAGTSALQKVQSGSQAVAQIGATMAATGGSRSLDIIKSIVYGGLIELITSLSVVSSAAGADAATLNVLALGLANIFGGLFVIIHDLWDLKNERTRKSEDRYQILLGQRADFPLHMVVSLISYLVFGFLPPIVYGFSFQASNDKDLKLLMVAAASIVCIMILAAAKAYVQSRSYLKTMSYYVVFGFMVSGVSYLFGGLIMKLLEKMDIFHLGSGSVENLRMHGMSSRPAFATY